MTTFVWHNRVRLALHRLQNGDGLALLLLHGLGERSPHTLPADYAAWPGPVYALDFTGHGDSDIPAGGGYSCEFLMADADCALATLGQAVVVGRGLGAYVALLLAGGRPQQVPAVVLRDGPGLAGGGTQHKHPYIPVVDTQQMAPPDPYAMADLSTDARPPEYALHYARLAQTIHVCTHERPEWLTAIVAELQRPIRPWPQVLADCTTLAMTGTP